VMYEMLAGKPPFEGSGPEIARANVQKKPPSLAERNPQVRVNPELEKIVFRLLEKRAADRFQTAEDVIAALDRFEQASRTPAPAINTEATESRPSPVLWLGRPTRRWRRELASQASRPVAAATPAPIGEAEDTTAWGPGRDGQPTVGMAAAVLPLPPARRRRRSVTATAWVASAIAAAAVATMLTGPRTPGGRDATAAVVPHEERAEQASNTAALELTGFIGKAAVSPLDAAQGLFGGKMDPAPSRCSNVPNAERIAAEPRSRTRARNADRLRRSRSHPARPLKKRLLREAMAARSPVQ
jgi:hypothetical protein